MICENEWRCTNTAEHVAPRGCVHAASSGSWGDAEPTGDDR